MVFCTCTWKLSTDATSSISELQKLLFDEDYDVRWAAYISLSKIDKKSLNVTSNLSEKISNRKVNS
jgi:HEAT repeat protein